MTIKLHNPDTLHPSTVLSYAAQVGNILFTSGLTPRDPGTGEIVEGDISVQARVVVGNLDRVLEAAGASITNVAKVTVYLTDIKDAGGMNNIYKNYFGEFRPARTTVEISSLTPGMLIEIEAIVALPD